MKERHWDMLQALGSAAALRPPFFAKTRELAISSTRSHHCATHIKSRHYSSLGGAVFRELWTSPSMN
jgi:hypothetical protein